jgi:hypothetical protein
MELRYLVIVTPPAHHSTTVSAGLQVLYADLLRTE